MTESMDATDYAFYLAYGMTVENEQLDSLLNVEMYNIMGAEDSAAFEARDSSVLPGDTSEAKATRTEF